MSTTAESPCQVEAGRRAALPQGPLAIRVSHVDHFFGEGEARKQALFDNSLEVHAGEIVIMTGPSGSGKTTLLTLIGTLRSVQQGEVEVLGHRLDGASPERLIAVRRELGFIFQHHNLFASLTSLQNVRMGLELFDITGAEADRRSQEILARLGLGQRIHYFPEKLSGGQKQRVAIARALAHRPKLILADEPTAALDGASGREVVLLFQELAKCEQCTVLMVTHDNRILDIADRIVNMVDGRIVSSVLVHQTAMICEFLRNRPPFEKLTPRALSYMADRMRAEVFAPGAVVVRQGDPGDRFYLIADGTVDVTKEDSGGRHTVNQLGKGEFFGEAALLTGERRNATVAAISEIQVYSLAKSDFEAVVMASSTFEEDLRKELFARQ